MNTAPPRSFARRPAMAGLIVATLVIAASCSSSETTTGEPLAGEELRQAIIDRSAAVDSFRWETTAIVTTEVEGDTADKVTALDDPPLVTGARNTEAVSMLLEQGALFQAGDVSTFGDGFRQALETNPDDFESELIFTEDDTYERSGIRAAEFQGQVALNPDSASEQDVYDRGGWVRYESELSSSSPFIFSLEQSTTRTIELDYVDELLADGAVTLTPEPASVEVRGIDTTVLGAVVTRPQVAALAAAEPGRFPADFDEPADNPFADSDITLRFFIDPTDGLVLRLEQQTELSYADFGETTEDPDGDIVEAVTSTNSTDFFDVNEDVDIELPDDAVDISTYRRALLDRFN